MYFRILSIFFFVYTYSSLSAQNIDKQTILQCYASGIKITHQMENKDAEKKKKWWQNLMETYRDTGYKRKEWAKKYNLVSPPTPPPENKEWFRKSPK